MAKEETETFAKVIIGGKDCGHVKLGGELRALYDSPPSLFYDDDDDEEEEKQVYPWGVNDEYVYWKECTKSEIDEHIKDLLFELKANAAEANNWMSYSDWDCERLQGKGE